MRRNRIQTDEERREREHRVFIQMRGPAQIVAEALDMLDVRQACGDVDVPIAAMREALGGMPPLPTTRSVR